MPVKYVWWSIPSKIINFRVVSGRTVYSLVPWLLMIKNAFFLHQLMHHSQVLSMKKKYSPFSRSSRSTCMILTFSWLSIMASNSSLKAWLLRISETLLFLSISLMSFLMCAGLCISRWTSGSSRSMLSMSLCLDGLPLTAAGLWGRSSTSLGNVSAILSVCVCLLGDWVFSYLLGTNLQKRNGKWIGDFVMY